MYTHCKCCLPDLSHEVWKSKRPSSFSLRRGAGDHERGARHHHFGDTQCVRRRSESSAGLTFLRCPRGSNTTPTSKRLSWSARRASGTSAKASAQRSKKSTELISRHVSCSNICKFSQNSKIFLLLVPPPPLTVESLANPVTRKWAPPLGILTHATLFLVFEYIQLIPKILDSMELYKHA